MKVVVFGLAVSSSWGNGHATLWRALARALDRRGHRLAFFERDQPYYAEHRDLAQLPGMELCIYRDFTAVRARADGRLAGADLAVVTSFCPDARAASALVLDSRAHVRCFYDLDTPVTLAALDRGGDVPYLPVGGLGDFDLVLSYTGGRALEALSVRLGARRTAVLYGCVDPDLHRPVPPRRELAGDLSYLGTYAEDRQPALAELLLAPAERLPRQRFVIGGALYPPDFPWRRNVGFVRHLAPGDHAAFYASSPLTLNVTRAAMAAFGYCPSARFFEAAACGVPVLTDVWDGIEHFFAPGREVLVARRRDDVVDAMTMEHGLLAEIGRRARERCLAEHTAERRVRELERIVAEAA